MLAQHWPNVVHPTMYFKPLFHCSTISFGPTLVQYWLTKEKNFSAQFQFYTAHVYVGPTLTLRFAPNANYKPYKGLPTLVNRSHAIITDLMKPDNTTEWSFAALYTIA